MRYGRNTALVRPRGPRLSSTLATSHGDVVAAQRLRWRVFVDEMGATVPDAESGLDRDRFDPYCDHLLVRDEESGLVVGTYRMLPAREARKLGGFASERFFDLGTLGAGPGLVEVGRACVHPRYRTGAVLRLLWVGLARYLVDGGFERAIGCASVFLGDDPASAESACRYLVEHHLTRPAWRVTPRVPFALDGDGTATRHSVPPLIRGYLSLGAEVCGPPAHDPEFGTADVLVTLAVDRLRRGPARRLVAA
jgi:putative hemolysin